MDSPTPVEVAAQVQRIVASSVFAGSDPMRNLLLYLAEHGIDHPGESVKEFALATEALGKGAEYDPRTDSSVRVIASRIRSKLAEYYTQDGARDSVIVTIPKGSYCLSGAFRPVDQPTSPPPETATANGTTALRARIVLAASVGILCGCVIGFYAGMNYARPALPEVTKSFWKGFVKGDPPIIVYSNPRFVGRADTGLHLFNPAAPAEGPVHGLFTGAGEVAAVREISHQLGLLGKEVLVKRAQLFTWDDARTRDLIFIGGQEQNLPMSQLPPLEKFNLKAESEEPFRSRGAVRNEKPAAGEQSYYFAGDDPENGIEYAIIALTPGVTPDKRVLILAGVHTFGTEGAAAFVCNPLLLSELIKRLGAKDGAGLPMFEALLELHVRGGSPLEPRLLIVHKRHDGSPA